jgi:hypothetical protein
MEHIESYILKQFPGIIATDAYAERSFFYNPEGKLPKGVYFATLKSQDGPNDKASFLQREGVYRLNIGVSKSTYASFFGPKPARAPKGGVVSLPYDFTQLDVLTPHPIYAWLHWVAILNPSEASMPLIENLLAEAYQLAVKKYQQKMGK